MMEEAAILDDIDLENIWYILVECSSSPARDKLSYEDVCQASGLCMEVCGPALEPYFSSLAFLGLARDQAGMVTCSSFLSYIMRRNSMLQVRSRLRHCGAASSGVITLEELRSFLSGMLPEMAALDTYPLHEDLSAYLTFATARFKVIVGDRSRLRVDQVLLSFVLADFLELKLPVTSLQDSNAMSPKAFEAARMEFAALDTDCSGFITEAQFARYKQGTFTPLCTHRLFELHGQQVDGIAGCRIQALAFHAFVEFATAWEFRHLDGSCHYLFQFLDLGAKGCTSEEDLLCFLKDLQQAWPPQLQFVQPVVEEVRPEILDMLGVHEGASIPWKTFTASGVASLVTGLLLNIQQFWEYDNREELLLAANSTDEKLR